MNKLNYLLVVQWSLRDQELMTAVIKPHHLILSSATLDVAAALPDLNKNETLQLDYKEYKCFKCPKLVNGL